MFRLLFTGIIIMCTSHVISFAQNLVPNGSFEQFSTCPDATAQLPYAVGWQFAGASTDYYNACSPSGNMSVPFNIYGYQDASDGVGYIGMIAYAVGEPPPYSIREPAGTSLIQALTIGDKYYVSFKVVLTLNDFESGGACNKLGAKFSTVNYSSSNPTPVDNFAHIYTDSIITDTLNWIMVSGSFLADSAYTFISIGNFFDSTNSQYSDINGLWFTESAYYYIDDVRVSTDSLFVVGEEQIVPFINVNIYPNPANDYINIEGSYDKPVWIEMYDITGRIISQMNTKIPHTINLEHCHTGIYMLFIKSEHYYFSSKLLINK